MDADKIYFDISATTPIDPRVINAMLEADKSLFGNPSSIHSFGQSSRVQIELSRQKIASALNCSRKEIIFTSGGSEANNQVLKNLLSSGDHIITSSYEHPSIIQTLESIDDIKITYLTPNKNGTIDPALIENEIKDNTKLISIMWANNELGTINDICKISKIALKHGLQFHTDAVQAFGKVPINLSATNINYMSITAHKIYGPKGVGALYIKDKSSISPLIHGGGQEQNIRSGTENTSSIIGFGIASDIACSNYEKYQSHTLRLEKELIAGLNRLSVRYKINGENRLPGVFSICFPGASGSELLMNLDINGIAISYGSACSSGSLKPSETLIKCGIDSSIAKSSVRISFGRLNTSAEINRFTKEVKKYVDNMKESLDE